MNFSLKAGRKIYESKMTLFLGMRPLKGTHFEKKKPFNHSHSAQKAI